MRYLCLGYIDQQKWEVMLEGRQTALLNEIHAYDDLLRKNGHFVGGETLVTARHSKTVTMRNSKLAVIDGPFAETKEQVGGVIVLEASSQEHAAQLMSEHPSVRVGASWEIRPVTELKIRS